MALGFNNQAVNFGNVDYSGYVHGAGAAMGGLNQGLGAVLQGVQQRAAERKQKEREKKMRDDLAPLVEQMSGGQINIKDVSPEALPMLWDRAQQMEQQRAQQAEQARMVETINGLARRPMNQETILGMQQAGVDPKVIGMLVEMSKPKEAPRIGTVMTPDIPGAQPMIYTQEGNLSPVPMTKPPGEGVRTETLPNGRQISIVGTRQYDAATGEPIAASRPQEVDPETKFNVETLRGNIAKLEQEDAEHKSALERDDKKYGFWNVTFRQDRRAVLAAELQQKKAELARLEGTARPQAQAAPKAPPVPGAPTAPAEDKQPDEMQLPGGFRIRSIR
jgi:hypothetical protein